MLVPSLFYLSLSLSLSFYSFYFAGEKRFSNWNKILFRRGVEITGPERPRTSLPCPRYFLVRATTSNASTHDACTRRSHAWRFVSTSRLVVFLCFGWHRPTSCRFLFPGPRVLRSLPSFSFFSSLFPSLSLSLSLLLFLFISVSIERVDTNKSTRPETLYLRDDVSQVESSLALLVGILTYFSSFLSSFLQFAYRFLSLEESSAITREFLVAVIRPFTSGFIEDDNPGLLEIRSAGPSQRDSNVGYYYPITRDVFIFPVSFSLSRAR